MASRRNRGADRRAGIGSDDEGLTEKQAANAKHSASMRNFRTGVQARCQTVNSRWTLEDVENVGFS